MHGNFEFASELKRRLKAEKKAKEKSEKVATVVKPAEAADDEKRPAAIDEAEIDPSVS